MWWFARRMQQQPPATAINTKQQVEDQLLAWVPDMSPVTTEQDVAIKVWLPESVAQAVKWLATYEGESQSAWLRDRLMEYAYGRVAALAQRIRNERAEYGAPCFSRRPVDRTKGRWIYKVPQLGKNTIAFKLWVSAQMRADLQALANHAHVPLSAFVREAIVADLLGRASLPERPEIVGHPTPAAKAWEEGEEVPVLELDDEPSERLGEIEMVWREDACL